MKQDLDISEEPAVTAVSSEPNAVNADAVTADDLATMHDGTEQDVPVTVIRARPGWHLLNVRELWRYRELLGFLALRDVKVRYRQTLFGVIWAIVPPIVLMIVFTVIFGKIAKFPTGDIPYPIFVFAGLLPWKFFTTALGSSVGSVVGEGQMISKVYFPRLILPFSRVAVAVIDFAIAFLILVALMAYYQIVPGWRVLLLPPLVLLTGMIALGFGTMLAAINVSFRDVRHMIPFVIQVGLFLTPAIYMDTGNLFSDDAKNTAVAEKQQTTVTPGAQKPDSKKKKTETAKQAKTGREGIVPDRLQGLLQLNPLMGLISSFRAAILDRPLPWMQLAYSTVVAIASFAVGCLYFERVQRNFADII